LNPLKTHKTSTNYPSSFNFWFKTIWKT